jgi:peptide/nickel transport system permease protein
VIFALIFAAVIQINFGALSHDGLAGTLRLVFGAVVLGFADGAFAGAVLGTRAVFEEEFKQRYVQIAILRGETVLSNALPNVLPALIGQLRGRMLHVLSGAIIVEVVLGIPGIGELLWDGTLLQDFGVVLAAAWGFALLSGGMLFAQATCEVLIEMYVRKFPGGVEDAVEASA